MSDTGCLVPGLPTGLSAEVLPTKADARSAEAGALLKALVRVPAPHFAPEATCPVRALWAGLCP
jgi:hypothetical protein